MKFRNKHCLIRHALEIHTGLENGRLSYTCNNCGKRYRHERDLKVHKERLCSGIGFQKTAAQLSLVRSALNLLKRFLFTTIAYCIYFRLIPLQIFGYQGIFILDESLFLQMSCPVCNGYYTASHLAKHHEYVHACRFCTMVCGSRKEKLEHLRKEHYGHMEKNACRECGERFESSSCLKRHAVVAHGRRTVKCPIDNCRQLLQKVRRNLLHKENCLLCLLCNCLFSNIVIQAPFVPNMPFHFNFSSVIDQICF